MLLAFCFPCICLKVQLLMHLWARRLNTRPATKNDQTVTLVSSKDFCHPGFALFHVTSYLNKDLAHQFVQTGIFWMPAFHMCVLRSSLSRRHGMLFCICPQHAAFLDPPAFSVQGKKTVYPSDSAYCHMDLYRRVKPGVSSRDQNIVELITWLVCTDYTVHC